MRCYDGCPDSDFQAELDARQIAMEKAEQHGMYVAFFPFEEKYMVFDSRTHLAVTGFFSRMQAAVEVALKKEGKV